MEHWYIPVTIVPGLGLLILSSSNLMIALSNEIGVIISQSGNKAIIRRKIAQLKLINRAMVFFYIGVALLLISAVISGILPDPVKSIYISIAAIISGLIGLLLLVIYSFKAVTIRQDQFKDKIH